MSAVASVTFCKAGFFTLLYQIIILKGQSISNQQAHMYPPSHWLIHSFIHFQYISIYYLSVWGALGSWLALKHRSPGKVNMRREAEDIKLILGPMPDSLRHRAVYLFALTF